MLHRVKRLRPRPQLGTALGVDGKLDTRGDRRRTGKIGSTEYNAGSRRSRSEREPTRLTEVEADACDHRLSADGAPLARVRRRRIGRCGGGLSSGRGHDTSPLASALAGFAATG